VHGTSFPRYSKVFLQNDKLTASTIPAFFKDEPVKNGVLMKTEVKDDNTDGTEALDVKEELDVMDAKQEFLDRGYQCPIQNCTYKTSEEVCKMIYENPNFLLFQYTVSIWQTSFLEITIFIETILVGLT